MTSRRSRSDLPRGAGGAALNPRVWAAALMGAIVGLGVMALMVMAGLLLYDRLWGGSSSILVAIYITFGGVGAYGGWLIGVIVFAAGRGEEG